MAKCATCGRTILFGGTKDGALRFCGPKCHERATLTAVAEQIPESELDDLYAQVHTGPCPLCHGAGPVDVHKYHGVYSALVFTRWFDKSQLSCRSCAVKRQAGYAFISLVFGWWGIPFGLVMTPVQIGRNIAGMVHPPDPLSPSKALKDVVLMNVATQLVASQDPGHIRFEPELPTQSPQ